MFLAQLMLLFFYAEVRRCIGWPRMIKRSIKYFIRRWKLTLLIAGVLFIAFSVISVEVTSQPKFCDSCHIMGPYYDSWSHGTHKDVSCVECHIAPGALNFVHAKLNGLGQVVDDLLNRTSTKPSASVSDFACTRSGCHVIGELGDKERKAGGAKYHFDHDKHLNMNYQGIEVHCTTCHSYIKGDEHFEVNTNACFACHLMNGHGSNMKKAADFGPGPEPSATLATDLHALGGNKMLHAPATCDACHTPPQERFEHNGILVDHAKYLSYGAACNSCHIGVTAPASKVDDSRCLNCHGFGKEHAQSISKEEMHRVHTEGKHKVECFNCHGLIQHGSLAQSAMLDQFDCQSCHSGQHDLQRGMYFKSPTLSSHHPETTDRLAVSPMFLTHVPCTGCHIENDSLQARPGSGAMVARATAESCDSCHKAGLGKMQVPLWQRNTRELHAEVTALLEAGRTRHADASGERAQLFADSQQLLDVVRLDGSWGVHNPRYTQYLLERARAKIAEANAQEDGH